MHVRNLAKKFELSFVVKDKWHLPVHKHTHFELQYIIRGNGQHIINDQTYNYQQGDLFVLPPQDTHFFIFNGRCAIGVVKFHETFFEEFLQDGDFRQLFAWFSSPNRKIHLSGANRQQVIQLMELVIAEYKKAGVYQHFIIKGALALVLALMANETAINVVQPKEEKIQAILNFIDHHITEKHLLSVQHMADQFNISKAYFNQYFTKATGSSYKKYIQQYALNLVAQQLVRNNRTLAQLADIYGYTDESHLSHAFKSHFGQTPSAFKKANP